MIESCDSVGESSVHAVLSVVTADAHLFIKYPIEIRVVSDEFHRINDEIARAFTDKLRRINYTILVLIHSSKGSLCFCSSLAKISCSF